MFTFSGGVLIGMVLAPALIALVAYTVGKRAPRLVGQLSALVAGLGFLGSVGLAIEAGRGDAVTVPLGALGLQADRLAVVLLLLVFGVSAIVQAFAVRYLAGDSRSAWFTAGAALLTAGSAGLMTATTLIGMAIGWTVAGAALCLLLATYWQLPAARDGVRRTALSFLVGDLALWTAVALVTAQVGVVNLDAIDLAALAGPTLPVAGILVLAAALSRSAQMPFHRWLPATLAAPTPVSALLHAGVVNAGGILLLRLSFLASTEPARALTILAGAATLAYGAVIMLVKPDIKGALAHSTMAQMGFMILTCGLGLWAAAVFHLVAHGFYKATLFLSSGSAVAHQRRLAARPPAAPLTSARRALHAATAVALPAAALYLAVAVIPTAPGDHLAEQALLAFAWVTGAAVTWGWLQRRPSAGGALSAAAVLVPVSLAYVGLIGAVSRYLAPALPATATTALTTWLIVGAALAALAGLAALRWAPAATRLQTALYARAITAGDIAPTLPARLTGARS